MRPARARTPGPPARTEPPHQAARREDRQRQQRSSQPARERNRHQRRRRDRGQREDGYRKRGQGCGDDAPPTAQAQSSPPRSAAEGATGSVVIGRTAASVRAAAPTRPVRCPRVWWTLPVAMTSSSIGSSDPTGCRGEYVTSRIASLPTGPPVAAQGVRIKAPQPHANGGQASARPAPNSSKRSTLDLGCCASSAAAASLWPRKQLGFARSDSGGEIRTLRQFRYGGCSHSRPLRRHRRD